MYWTILIVTGLIFIGAVVLGEQRNKRLVDEGKIIKRKVSFVETAEIFTLKEADYSKLIPELKAMDISGTGVSWEGYSAKQLVVFRSSHGWSAQLSLDEDNEDQYKYRFQFTKWQTRKGAIWRIDTMNMLLTSIEKAFLRLDSSTQVETELLKLKTRSKFF